MAKTAESTEVQEAPAAPQAAPQQQQQFQIEVDDSHIVASYANFCRVTGSPEELIIDFGLNPQPMGVPTKPIPVVQRIIVNYFTAKRLLAALSMSSNAMNRSSAFWKPMFEAVEATVPQVSRMGICPR